MIVNSVQQIVLGSRAPLVAVRFLLRHPKLLPYCIIPTVISVCVHGVLLLLTAWQANRLLGQLFTFSDTWYIQLLHYAVIGIVIVALLGVFAMLYSAITNLIAGPFHELLSQRVEQYMRNDIVSEQFQWRSFARDGWRAIKEESVKLILFLVVELCILLLNFIPIIGTVLFTIMNGLLIGWLLAYEYVDLPLSRDHYNVNQKIRFVLHHSFTTLPFGWLCGLIVCIPIVNTVMIPLCVVAGTILSNQLKSGTVQEYAAAN